MTRIPDPLDVDVCTFEAPLSAAIPCDATLKPNFNFRDSVDGAFKTPTLRNIALTAPYFHSGQVWDLRQAVAIMGSSQLGHELDAGEVEAITRFLHTLTGTQPRVAHPVLPTSTLATPRPE